MDKTTSWVATTASRLAVGSQSLDGWRWTALCPMGSALVIRASAGQAALCSQSVSFLSEASHVVIICLEVNHQWHHHRATLPAHIPYTHTICHSPQCVVTDQLVMCSVPASLICAVLGLGGVWLSNQVHSQAIGVMAIHMQIVLPLDSHRMSDKDQLAV